jgi:hypothetical protein
MTCTPTMRECPPRPWQVLSFAPFFFSAAFLGRFVVLAGPGEGIPFETVMGSWGYPAWFALGIACPPLLLVSWRLVRRGGHYLYPGLWIRLGADIGMAAGLAAFIAAYWLEHVKPRGILDDSHLLSIVLLGSIWCFLVTSVVFDVWRIVALSNVAARIRRSSV